MTKQMSNTSKYAKELNLKSLPTKYISKPKNNTPYIEEFRQLLREEVGLIYEYPLGSIETSLVDFLTKTMESERERVIGEIEKYVEEERCDGHMPFYSRDFESMFDQINKLKKK